MWCLLVSYLRFNQDKINCFISLSFESGLNSIMRYNLGLKVSVSFLF